MNNNNSPRVALVTGASRGVGHRYRRTEAGWRIVESVSRLHSQVNGRHLGEHDV